MKKHDTVTRMEEVSEHKLTEICCNKCGTKSEIHYEGIHEADFSVNEYQTFSTYFGYGSRFDNERWEFDLCEDCLVELIKTFKYSPSGFGQDTYLAHDEQLMFKNWKETGQIDLEVGMTEEEKKANGGSIYEDYPHDDTDDSYL